MTIPQTDAQVSADGNSWWDGEQWQPVSQGGETGAAGQAAAAGGQPAAAPQVVLIGTAGFDPAFPEVGKPIVYTWSEENIGGALIEPYNAKVEFKDPDGNILNADKVLVECQPLATNQPATRSTDLPAPTKGDHRLFDRALGRRGSQLEPQRGAELRLPQRRRQRSALNRDGWAT